jgi:hypothetical protein
MRFPIAIVLVVAVALLSDARAEPATSATRVVLLGSGTPNPEPESGTRQVGPRRGDCRQ